MGFRALTTGVVAVSAIALLAPEGVKDLAFDGFVSAAYAHEDGEDGEDGEGGRGPAAGQGQGHQGGQGQGGKGAQAGQGNQGGQGAGQGGPDPSSDSKGPQAGGPASTGRGGGKPVWAQEGIPEVELGRLSVARAPAQVLDRAYNEAVANLTPDMVSFYNQPLDDMLYDFAVNWDSLSIYDSPLQNLSLFRDVLADGQSELPGIDDSDPQKLLAVFLGVASDKNVSISEDTVEAMVTILSAQTGTAISVDVGQLADDAEDVRIAVLAGHG